MDKLNAILEQVGGFIWGWPLIILLLGTHLYLTIILRFPQRHIFKAIKLSVSKESDSNGDISQFGALATSLAATIGTGNIIGVATAITIGGPGAVVWCWLTGILGIATKYAEGLLAVKYRIKSPDGRMLGGPMYALEYGLGLKWLAILFAILTVGASFGIGNMVQSNAISLICEGYHIPTYITGVIVAIIVMLVVVFGVKGISRVCSLFVPFMALLYILGCCYILYINSAYVGSAIRLIVTSAFNPSAAGGGFIGGSIIITARYGVARGLFSNESGMGSAPIVAAAAQTRNPVRQALVSSSGTFWDTVILCALTGIVLVSCIIAYPDVDYSAGASLTMIAFDKIPIIGRPTLTFGIVTFAFSTILGWSYYGERAMEYLGGRKAMLVYRYMFVVGAFLGAVVKLAAVWNFADILNGLMIIPNIVALIGLSGIIISETRHYLWSNHLDESMELEGEKEEKRDNGEEIFPIVDSIGKVIGQAKRKECHNGSKILHPVVHLHLLNSKGELFLQHRPKWKDIQPDRWDTSVGGHIEYGESVEEALRRELFEELGIRESINIKQIFSYIYESDIEKEYIYSHIAVYDGTITTSDELDGGKFWSIESIEHSLGKGIFTQNFEYEYRTLLKDLINSYIVT